MQDTRDGSDRAEGDTRGHEETVLPSGEAVPVREARQVRRKRDDDIPPGMLLGGHYRVVRRLGGGAIGHVYEAINTWTTRRVALKLLRSELVDDPDIARRFLIEAQAATRVAHPHIVDILDMGKDPASGNLYIVQEFLEGRDLHQHLKQRGRLTLLEAQQVLVPVMQAVAAAHEKGVLHRDLKPENVFLVQSPDGHTVPKVIDFGLARTETTGGNRMTRTGAVMGTPYYMSPEQARGEPSLDARADVWALGVIWYELLAGELPFKGENLHQVLHAIFMSTPRRLHERVPEVPADVSNVIHRALSRDLTIRYASMNDFLDAFADVLPDDPLPPTTLRSSRPGRQSVSPPPNAASPATRSAPYTISSPPRGASTHATTGPVPAASPAPESVRVSRDDARRIRSLYAVIGVALAALVVVSLIALQLLKREERGGASRPAEEEASRAVVAHPTVDARAPGASIDAAVVLADVGAPGDVSPASDLAPDPEEPGARHRSRRSRHGGRHRRR